MQNAQNTLKSGTRSNEKEVVAFWPERAGTARAGQSKLLPRDLSKVGSALPVSPRPSSSEWHFSEWRQLYRLLDKRPSVAVSLHAEPDTWGCCVSDCHLVWGASRAGCLLGNSPEWGPCGVQRGLQNRNRQMDVKEAVIFLPWRVWTYSALSWWGGLPSAWSEANLQQFTMMDVVFKQKTD